MSSRNFRSNVFERTALCLLLCAGLLLLSTPACAQDGQFDSSFADGGRALVDVSDGNSDQGTRLYVYPDGRMLIGGTCNGPNSPPTDPPVSKFCATRLRADGTYDPTFGPGGIGYVRFDRFSNFVNEALLDDMLVLEDGRIVMLGSDTNLGPGLYIAVLLADGTALDATVGTAGIVQYTIGGISSQGGHLLEQPDGKILVAATVTGINGNLDFGIARFMPGLAGLDGTFGSAGAETIAFDLGGPDGDNADSVLAIGLESDGTIVMAGGGSAALKGATTPLYRIVACRLLANGQRDVTFGPNGDGRMSLTPSAQYEIAYDMKIDQRGRIVLAGVSGSSTGPSNWYVFRLTRDGAADSTFNSGLPRVFRFGPTSAGSYYAERLALTNDGIIAFGWIPRGADTAHWYWGVAKLSLAGAFDTRFGSGGFSYSSFAASSYNDAPRDIAVTPRGLILVGTGQQTMADKQEFGIARLQYEHIFGDSFETE